MRPSRLFVLFLGFLSGAVAGGWLGLVAAVLAGLVPLDRPVPAPEDVLSAIIAAMVLLGLARLMGGAAGSGLAPEGLARAEGRLAAKEMLLVAVFCALNVLCTFALGSSGGLTPVSLAPAALVAMLASIGAARRSLILRCLALVAGSLYTAGAVFVLVSR